ncbi:DUF2493 domain-containing protein [Kiloniella sp.]|uniref:DUF2493 domain-containing protein n=1 Tax=Kiloniella sp. TaxID=1938587 RepID=UPI003B01C290
MFGAQNELNLINILEGEKQMEQSQNLTATSAAIETMELYGTHPFAEEKTFKADLSEEEATDYLSEIMTSLADQLEHSVLDDLTSVILSDLVNIFNRRANSIGVKIDKESYGIKDLLASQDGSEINDTLLQDAQRKMEILEGQQLALEQFCLCAGEVFETITGKAWMPHTRQSLANRKQQTASVIDAKDFLKARKVNETLVHLPKGTPILFSGDQKITDMDKVTGVLDRLLKKYADMYLVTTGNAKGGDLIAGQWARTNKVQVVQFGIRQKGKKAPFDRNREIFTELTPALTIVFGQGGIQQHLRKLAKENGLKSYQGEDC